MTIENSKREFLLDNRISSRHIRQGLLDREDFEKYLASLPDLIDACEDIGEEIYGSELSSSVHLTHYDHDEDEEA